jgi:glycosyltransferase involved in cell wall biosynthesis
MAARPYSALFITHDAGYYGASRSLQGLLREYESKRVDLAINRRVFGKNDVPDILARFGPNVQRVHELPLPFARCFKGKPPPSWRLAMRNAVATLTRRATHAFISRLQPDFVHLNSLVLHPLVRADLPFIVHVREIHDGTDARAYRSLCRARGVIFIDEASKAPFGQLPVPTVILNNPIDMRGGDTEKSTQLRNALGGAGKVVFGVVGQMNENKGTAFIIRAFVEAQVNNAVLLLVGEGEPAYLEHCRQLAKGAPNVFFQGFASDVASIYGAVDFVLRGEAYPCVGRTIYEGLYAGCAAIVPGADGCGLFDYERYRDRLFFYEPRNQAQLTECFRVLTPRKPPREPAVSNVAQFVEGFDRFVAQVLGT